MGFVLGVDTPFLPNFFRIISGSLIWAKGDFSAVLPRRFDRIREQTGGLYLEGLSFFLFYDAHIGLGS